MEAVGPSVSRDEVGLDETGMIDADMDVMQALSGLSERQRMSVVLYYYGGYRPAYYGYYGRPYYRWRRW